jgi:hypothetical protein
VNANDTGKSEVVILLVSMIPPLEQLQVMAVG